MKMESLLAVALIAALTGCATGAKFQTKMNGFVGQSEAAVVGAYGPPMNSYVLGDGSRVLQYTRGGQAVIPGMTTMQPVTTNTYGNMNLNQGFRQTSGNYSQTSTTYVPQQGAATVVNLACTVNFTIDKAGIVQAWRAEGNHCVSD